MEEESIEAFEANVMIVLDRCHTPDEFIAEMDIIAQEQIVTDINKIDDQKGSFFYMAGRKLFNEGLFEYALGCCQKAIEHLIPVSRKNSIYTYYMLGKIYRHLRQPTLSIQNFQKGITLCNKEHIFLDLEYSMYLELARITQDRGVYKDMIDLVSKHHDYRRMANCYLDLGNFYTNKEELTYAEYNYKEAIKVFNTYTITNRYVLGRAYLGLGNVYREYGIYSVGIEYMYKALKIFESGDPSNQDNTYAIACCHSNLGNIYIDYAYKRSPSEYPDKPSKEVMYYMLKSLNHFSIVGKLSEEINEQDLLTGSIVSLLDDTMIKIASFSRHVSRVNYSLSNKVSQIYSYFLKENQLISDENEALEIMLLEIIKRQAQQNPYIAIFASLELIDIYLYHFKTPKLLDATLCIEKALKLPARNHWITTRLQCSYGIILFLKGKAKESYNLLYKSIHIDEEQSKIIINDNIKVNMHGQREDYYYYMILVCLKLDKSDEALYYLESSKSRAFRELLLTGNISPPKEIDYDFRTQEKELILSIRNAVIHMVSDPHERLNQAKIMAQLRQLYKTYSNIIPDYTSIRLGNVISYKRIKQIL